MATTTDNYRLVVKTQGANQAKTQLQGLRGVAVGLGSAFGALQLGRGFIQSIGLIRDFEFSMSRVRAISGATEKEFAALEQTARTLGATTIFSARQAAEGMIFLSQAGFTAGETVKVTADALKLAQAGALGLAEAADITAKTIRIFNLEAEESGRVADVLSKAAASSNTNVSQLGQALSFLGPVAKTLNIGLEETVALIGLTSDRGIQAGRAGTGLRQVLLSLVNPTTEAADKMRELGINVEDVANRARSGDITGVLETLDVVFQDAGLAAEVFSRRAVAAGFAVGQNREQLLEFIETLKNAEGSAEEMARIMNNTLQGAFKSFRSIVEESILLLGTDSGFSGVLKEAVQTITGAIAEISGLTDAFEKSNVVSDEMRNRIEVLSQALLILKDILTLLAARVVLQYSFALLGSIGNTIKLARATGILATSTQVLRANLGGIIAVILLATQHFSRWSIEIGDATIKLDALKATVIGFQAALKALSGIFQGNFNVVKSYREALDELVQADIEKQINAQADRVKILAEERSKEARALQEQIKQTQKLNTEIDSENELLELTTQSFEEYNKALEMTEELSRRVSERKSEVKK